MSAAAGPPEDDGVGDAAVASGRPGAHRPPSLAWRAAAFDLVPVFVLALDDEMQVVWANERARQEFGYNGQLQGASVAQVVVPEDLPLVATGSEVARLHPELMTPARYRLRRADGSTVATEVFGTQPGASPEIEGLGYRIVCGWPVEHRDAVDAPFAALAADAPLGEVLAAVQQAMVVICPRTTCFVTFDGPDGSRAVVGPASDGPHDDPLPDDWFADPADPARRGPRVIHDLDVLGGDLAARVRRAEAAAVGVVPVEDPGGGRPAALVGWAGSAVLAERFVERVRRECHPVVGLALRRREDAARLVRAARTDAVTGLANRFALDEVLTSLARPPEPAAPARLGVLYLDLDHFKAVNDTRGHAAGDAVLGEVARRLERLVRAGDLVARLGGDEFAVVCPAVTDEELRSVAERIIGVVAEPIELTGAGDDPDPSGSTVVSVGVSVGAVVGLVDDDPFALVDRADAAMYVAKREGRGRLVVASDRSPPAG